MDLYLPAELVELIALCLSNNEQFHCLTISKKWYESIFRALYKIIRINYRRQLKLLLKLFSYQPKYGLLVRQIYFNKSSHNIVGITTQELDQLITYCPFLEILDFDQSIWKYIKHASIFKYQLKQLPTLNLYAPSLFLLENPFYLLTLTQLTLCGELVSQLFDHSPRLIQLLSNTPDLRRLTLDSKQHKSHVIYVSYHIIEAIHTSLTKLEELEITGSFQFHIQNGDGLLGFIYPTKVRRLKLKANLLPPQWIYYIAQKYPQLEELDLEVMNTADNLTSYHQREGIQYLFSLLLDHCLRLCKIQLDSRTATMYLTPFFFERSTSHKSLKEIKIKNIPYNLVSCEHVFFDTLVKYGQQLVTGLGTEFIDTNPLSHFTNLTELSLCCGYPYVDCGLNLLLIHCKKLKHLTIRSAHVMIEQLNYVYYRELKGHPLISLHLSAVSFSSDIFVYLGNACPALNQLSIYDCSQRDNFANCIHINMPNNNFHSIIINGIRLDSVLLHALVWMPNARVLSIKTATGKKKRWYHVYNRNKLCYPVNPKIQRLNARKATIAECYYQLNHQSYLDEIIKWEDDLLFGQIEIQCRSIKHWEFICHTTFNEF
ncbi:uncharacterized protein BX663DRAFT_427145 [Cokeromyces recurvatus]|uniref:uncharacterized protein n=1 Tax=Cokeromyces recurvatus TaxID=90255 RepID=UPI002220213A|nr:uncharacterized protein BX663DRAFT_427145 [Cokeromyces recurvatus]KAI7906849.1 hypothetical protein BX663DRAFT_427145 [Cokeromyces recurvatus]